MCGIAGVVSTDKPHFFTIPMIAGMAEVVRHRGPDEAGVYLDDHAGLAHARLSIIDIASGQQPMSSRDGSHWVVFNGEIFNYIELRDELSANGHIFETSSDTEVILHAYEEYGPKCLTKFNGQFAFAIWTPHERTLFCARDRVGIRPLHYIHKNGLFGFASEVKSLFATGLFEPHIDPIALDQIFTFWTTLPGRTFFDSVSEVPPGHYLILRDGVLSLHRYWEIPFCHRDEQLDWQPERICDEIRGLLTDAVRIRLRADVPVGAYLSGGLDSSALTTLVVRNFDSDVNTFSIRFDEKAYDEGDPQQIMRSHLGVPHREISVSNEMIRTSFPEIIRNTERPLVRTAPVPLYHLSRLVRDSGFKVVLTGEGADEVFGGYNIFRENKVRRFWAREPGSEFRHLLLKRLYPYIFTNPLQGKLIKNFFARGLTQTDDLFYSHRIRWNNTRRLQFLFSRELRDRLGDYDPVEDMRSQLPDSFEKRDDFARAQYLEMWIFMSNYLLSSQGDRVAMANSLEIRVPFLDHRLIEFMARIPAHRKIQGLDEKHILKKAFADLLPDAIVNRPKTPYRAPIHNGLMDERSTAILTENRLATSNVFDPQQVQKLLDKIQQAHFPSEVDDMGLAGIISTQSACELFIEGGVSRHESHMSLSVCVDHRSGKSS